MQPQLTQPRPPIRHHLTKVMPLLRRTDMSNLTDTDTSSLTDTPLLLTSPVTRLPVTTTIKAATTLLVTAHPLTLLPIPATQAMPQLIRATLLTQATRAHTRLEVKREAAKVERRTVVVAIIHMSPLPTAMHPLTTHPLTTHQSIPLRPTQHLR